MVFILTNKHEIGKSIRERRMTLRIRPGRLAELAGMAVHTISNSETGKGNVTVATLLKAAQVLGCAVRIGP